MSEEIYKTDPDALENIETISEIQNLCHQLAKSKGWWPEDETDEHRIANKIANLHGELSELWESFRNGQLYSPCDKCNKMAEHGLPRLNQFEEEAADIFIRLADLCGFYNINLERAIKIKHLYNETRSFRHGGKKA